MRRPLTLAILLLAGCSQEEPKRSAEDLKTFDVEEEPASAACSGSPSRAALEVNH